VESFQ